MASRRKLIQRVSARVFCHLEEQKGGNPVTIFSSAQALSSSAQIKLARQCEWESVMINDRPDEGKEISSNSLPQLSFYMPSGEQVSFCAHAAMGAALEICLQKDKENHVDGYDYSQDEVLFTVADLADESTSTTTNANSSADPKEFTTTMYDGDIVALNMETTYNQSNVSQPSMLFRMLRDYCAIDAHDLASTPTPDDTKKWQASSFEKYYPYINCQASIARPKTLIPLRDVNLLNTKVVAPPAAPPEGGGGFALTCSALDNTTGLYLYAKCDDEDGAWECRQFPRASGYPEDPATGIAAAALACHLHHHLEIDLPAYKFYQGTAMGKPSLIVVDELELKPSSTNDVEDDEAGRTTMDASFRLLGRVEIDERDTLEIDDEGAGGS